MKKPSGLTGLVAILTLFACAGGVRGQEPGSATSSRPVPDFAEKVAPIIHEHCAGCHRPGEAAPFPLLDYRDVQKRGAMIARVVKDRIMPPWLPVEGHGRFVDDLRLDDATIRTLVDWVEGGMPLGDAAKVPPAPTFASEWPLGEPDLVLSMKEGFPVDAGGPDIYRNFALPLPIDHEVYIAAIAVRPSARSVLHHIVFDIQTSGRSTQQEGRDGKPGWDGMQSAGAGAFGRRGSGTAGDLGASGIGGWAVGGQARRLPMGLGRAVQPGSDLILRSHFHPSGKAEVEKTTIGLYFTREKPSRSVAGIQLPPAFGVFAGIDIPAGKDDFEIHDEYTLPVDAEGLTVAGHAHQICKEMELTATPPEGEARSIFLIRDWDFDWQNQYQYVAPEPLPRGTKLSVRIRYDNSAANPANPFSPPRRMRWGLQSTDEMGSISILVVAKDESESEVLHRSIRRHTAEASRGGASRSGMEGLFISQLKMRDKDGDGKIQMDELPERFRPLAERFDLNGDGAIDDEEIEEASGSLGGRREGPAADLELSLNDTKGRRVRPLVLAEGVKAQVYYFVTPDCPIANGYAPTMIELAKAYADRGIRFGLVQVDPDTTPELAEKHAKEFGLEGFPTLLDGRQRLAQRFGLSKVPAVVVVGPSGKAVYSGRIDDRWTDLGKPKAEPGRRDLALALDALLEGRPIDQPKTDVVGCDLPNLPTR